MNGNNEVAGWIQSAKEGDTVGMEVDLREEDAKKRVVRFVHNGRIYRTVITSLPPSVQFGVCTSSSSSLILSHSFLLIFHYLYTTRYHCSRKIVILHLRVMKNMKVEKR